MLTGQAKRDYQRDWVRQKRAKVRQGSTVGSTRSNQARSNKDNLWTKLEEAGLALDGNQLSISSKSSPVESESNTRIPLYNRRVHKQGDVVILGGQVVTVPELDADGIPLS